VAGLLTTVLTEVPPVHAKPCSILATYGHLLVNVTWQLFPIAHVVLMTEQVPHVHDELSPLPVPAVSLKQALHYDGKETISNSNHDDTDRKLISSWHKMNTAMTQ
jgi:hypothetical protein